MRKMFFALVATLFASFAVMAQDAKTAGDKPTAQQRTERQIERLNKELTLTSEQREKVALALSKANTQIDEIRKAEASNKMARKEKLGSVKAELETTLKGILNEEQFQRYQEMRRGNEERRHAHRKMNEAK